MTRFPKRVSLLWLAASLFLALPAAAAEKIQGPLMGVEWLLANRANAEVLVLDASPPPLHAKEHIPGAVSASIMSFGAREAPAAEMERRFRSWGIGAGRKVVLYDQGDPMWATRLYFDLHRHGFPTENLFVLDGGLAKWKEVGGAVTKEPTPAPAPGDFRVSAPKEELRVRLPEFLAASGDTRGNALVEALDASWHFGETAFFDRGGHIPNGILVPSDDFYNADKTFKSAAEMQRMLDYLGVKRGQQVLTYCGGGVAASVPYFAMKHLLGYPKVRLYVESELEWLRDDRGLPFWTYGAPYLMRETGWLKTWGGRMMRMYGVSDVSIVDVRPADAFAFGHLPFALNVPADEFRRHLASPAKLAEMLAKAGVRASDEAVVVSGAGLDKDSALAFLLLERLGQQRVSVFMDSQEKSVQAGLALADPKTPTAPSPLSASYSATPREGVLIGSPSDTRGVYPKVFVASGKQVPVRVPEGKVVHVPYTELLNADGTPKAAKDIWKTLVKAGVPRYAELVSFSDDPGEAAVNYFVLKLMGFPDVKVLGM